MSYDDWSSRKLRRKYLQAIKEVWWYSQRSSSLAKDFLREWITARDNYKEELNRRGWMV